MTALVALALIGGCGGSTLRPSGDPLSVGTWGGDNSGVIVTDSNIHVHIGCTFGDIRGQVSVDNAGRFTVAGTYVLKAFPVQTGPQLAAQFSGRLVGRALTISVAVNDTTTGQSVALGPVTVRYGEDPKLGPCPICRIPKP